MAAGLLADATILTAGAVAATAAAAAAGWAVVRFRGARPTLRAARRALEHEDLPAALIALARIRPQPNAPVRPWHAEQRQLEIECLHAAAEAALRDRRFADALEHHRAVAHLVGLNESEANRRVVEAMLAEARRLSVAAPDGPTLRALLDLILQRQSPCPEASFWLGLYHLRHKDTAAGIAALETAHAATQGRQVDPALYLGAAWLREGKPREALRMLAEANRLAPSCPLIAWQLGTALTASGGDALLALRALQKATAADGLPKYLHAPNRLWADTLPADSWIRNLAQRAGSHRVQFRCPLGLDRVESVLRSAQLALAQAMVVCGRGSDAIPVYLELLRTRGELSVRRGLGLALAQAGEWDEALPHLRQAHAAEKPATPETTGALALCLANAAGNRTSNVRQALALIASLKVRADADWARRAGAVFSAARAAGVPVSADEVAELANVLASTAAADATAAAVYDLLADVRPAVPVESARLYVRAAQQEGVDLGHDEQLFDLAMTDRPATRDFFDAREWDFDSVEQVYLERWAVRHAGTFPTAPGPGYATEAAASLLATARRHAAQNHPDAAREVAELLLRLRPDSGPAYDLLAELAFRRGNHPEAVKSLKCWQEACPNDPVPLARLAAIAANENRPVEAAAIARRALELVRGTVRVPYLLLAARLSLAAGKSKDALALFDECLELVPDQPIALAGRAALAWTRSDFPTLAGLADRMASLPAEDPWFHYLAGAATLLAGRLDEAEVSAKYAAADPATAAEGRHLLALVRDRQNDASGAAELLRDPTVAAGAAAEHAVALRGQAAWRGGDYGEALRCWQALPAARLKTWNLTTVLGGTAFLAGIQALRAGNVDEAATWLRQAARLGHADPRLESLLTAASARAGAAGRNVELLEQAMEAGGARPELIRHLARAYRKSGRLAEARRLLDRAAEDPSLSIERGLLSLAQGRLLPAEQAFAAALAAEPSSAAAAINLVFIRLSVGRLTEAAALLPRAATLAPSPELKRLLENLHRLTSRTTEAPADWTLDDDRSVVQLPAVARAFGFRRGIVRGLEGNPGQEPGRAAGGGGADSAAGERSNRPG